MANGRVEAGAWLGGRWVGRGAELQERKKLYLDDVGMATNQP